MIEDHDTTRDAKPSGCVERAALYMGPAGVPAGFVLAHESAVTHPDNPGVRGALVRNVATGVYSVVTAPGVLASCPQGWARSF